MKSSQTNNFIDSRKIAERMDCSNGKKRAKWLGFISGAASLKYVPFLLSEADLLKLKENYCSNSKFTLRSAFALSSITG